MQRILIVKIGYSETLDPALSLSTSLGDVLRTTFILHYYKNDHVSWLVDEMAVPLLKGNPFLNDIYIYNKEGRKSLNGQSFDLIINFEKDHDICLFAKSLPAKKRIGFDIHDNVVDPNENFEYLKGTDILLEINKNPNKKRNNNYCWQKILADVLGQTWNGEEYILGYKPRTQTKYDIGFNWATSNKWANKTWPHHHWVQLQELIKDSYTVRWQEGFENLHQYIDWINSCRLIITSDSLGLHIALALKKKVVALFGPTSSKEVYFYNCGFPLLPSKRFNCLPCFKPVCTESTHCMEHIKPQTVKEKIEHVFKTNTITRAL